MEEREGVTTRRQAEAVRRMPAGAAPVAGEPMVENQSDDEGGAVHAVPPRTTPSPPPGEVPASTREASDIHSSSRDGEGSEQARLTSETTPADNLEAIKESLTRAMGTSWFQSLPPVIMDNLESQIEEVLEADPRYPVNIRLEKAKRVEGIIEQQEILADLSAQRRRLKQGNASLNDPSYYDSSPAPRKGIELTDEKDYMIYAGGVFMGPYTLKSGSKTASKAMRFDVREKYCFMDSKVAEFLEREGMLHDRMSVEPETVTFSNKPVVVESLVNTVITFGSPTSILAHFKVASIDGEVVIGDSVLSVYDILPRVLENSKMFVMRAPRTSWLHPSPSIEPCPLFYTEPQETETWPLHTEERNASFYAMKLKSKFDAFEVRWPPQIDETAFQSVEPLLGSSA